MGQKVLYKRRFDYNDKCKYFLYNKHLHIEFEELFRINNQDFICNNCGIKNSYGTEV